MEFEIFEVDVVIGGGGGGSDWVDGYGVGGGEYR